MDRKEGRNGRMDQEGSDSGMDQEETEVEVEEVVGEEKQGHDQQTELVNEEQGS